MNELQSIIKNMIDWANAAEEARRKATEQASKPEVADSAVKQVKLISCPAAYGLSSSEVRKQLDMLEYTEEDRHCFYHFFDGRFLSTPDEFDAGFLNYLKNIRNTPAISKTTTYFLNVYQPETPDPQHHDDQPAPTGNR